jgi:hypothetical protein
LAIIQNFIWIFRVFIIAKIASQNLVIILGLIHYHIIQIFWIFVEIIHYHIVEKRRSINYWCCARVWYSTLKILVNRKQFNTDLANNWIPARPSALELRASSIIRATRELIITTAVHNTINRNSVVIGRQRCAMNHAIPSRKNSPLSHNNIAVHK